MDALVYSNFPNSPNTREPEGALRRYPSDVEAPDQGEHNNEAPESRTGRSAEAPDAGEGRLRLGEHEFTHGRSQS